MKISHLDIKSFSMKNAIKNFTSNLPYIKRNLKTNFLSANMLHITDSIIFLCKNRNRKL